MCKAATCDVCDGKTWRGCGLHVPSVLDNVPKDEWCTCVPKKTVDDKVYPPMVGQGHKEGEEPQKTE